MQRILIHIKSQALSLGPGDIFGKLLITDSDKGVLIIQIQAINSTGSGNFQTHIKDRYLEHFLRNCPQVNATRPHGYLVNTNSGNDLVLWGNKSLPEPILTKYCQISNISRTISYTLNVSCLVLPLLLPNPLKPGVQWRMKMDCGSLRCSWSIACRRCSNYIWVIHNFIAHWGASYIRYFTVLVTLHGITRLWWVNQQHIFQLSKPVLKWPNIICNTFCNWPRLVSSGPTEIIARKWGCDTRGPRPWPDTPSHLCHPIVVPASGSSRQQCQF